MFSDAEVRDWALAIVDASENPVPEITEVLSSRNRENLLETLRDAQRLGSNNGELQTAGRWLLWELHRGLLACTDGECLSRTSQQALRVVQDAELSANVQSLFARLDGALEMAMMGYAGSQAECHAEFLAALRSLAVRPALQED